MIFIRKTQKFILGFCLICIGFLLFSVPSSAKSKENSSSAHFVYFDRLDHGQYIVETHLNGQGPFRFMIDTAASRTSIFDNTRKKLGIPIGQDKEVLISGMINSSYRPTVNVQHLQFGNQVFNNHKVVVLTNWVDKGDKLDGILGVEVFEDLVLQFFHESNRLKISKNTTLRKSRYRNWRKIKLVSNPYPGQDFGLLFTYTRIGNLRIPTMVDTGANFTTLNWASVKGTVVEKYKRRLREEWVVQGAIGEFKPRSRIKMDELIIGGIKFIKHDLLIMDFDKLPINGHGKYPLVITGVDLMAGQDFVLDFKNQQLLIKPTKKFISVVPTASRIKKRKPKYLFD